MCLFQDKTEYNSIPNYLTWLVVAGEGGEPPIKAFPTIKLTPSFIVISGLLMFRPSALAT
jgi:hypothetical protein